MCTRTRPAPTVLTFTGACRNDHFVDADGHHYTVRDAATATARREPSCAGAVATPWTLPVTMTVVLVGDRDDGRRHAGRPAGVPPGRGGHCGLPVAAAAAGHDVDAPGNTVVLTLSSGAR